MHLQTEFICRKNYTEKTQSYLFLELTDNDVKVDPKCQYPGFIIKKRYIIYLYNSIMKRGKEGKYDMSIKEDLFSCKRSSL